VLENQLHRLLDHVLIRRQERDPSARVSGQQLVRMEFQTAAGSQGR
jgi:hypothetical protein